MAGKKLKEILKPEVLLSMMEELDESNEELKAKEKELLESEERFNQVTQVSGEWIWEVDSKGRYTYSSPVVKGVLGYEIDEIVGKKYFFDFFHPKDRAALKKQAFKGFSKKLPFKGFINRNVTKEGKEVWFSTAGVPILDKKGKLLGYRGADRDITERKIAEEKLRESEERQNLVLEYSNDLIYAADMKTRIFYASPNCKRITGYTSEEARGMSIAQFIKKSDIIHTLWAFRNAFKTGKSPGVKFNFVRKDGSTFMVQESGRLIKKDGKLLGLSGVLRDISKYTEYEQKLKESEERYRSIIENIEDLAYSMDAKGKLTFMSPNVKKLMGYKPEEIVGKKITSFIHKGDIPGVLKMVAKTLITGKMEGVDFRVRHKNGSYFLFEERGNAIKEKGKIVGFSGILRKVKKCKNKK